MSNKYNRMFPASVGVSELITLYILHLLSITKTPMYGKEIIDIITDRFNGVDWKPSHGIVYPKLDQLELDGYLISIWDDDTNSNKRIKRYYSITEAGNEYYKKLLLSSEQSFVKSLIMIDTIINDLYENKGDDLK